MVSLELIMVRLGLVSASVFCSVLDKPSNSLEDETEKSGLKVSCLGVPPNKHKSVNRYQ